MHMLGGSCFCDQIDNIDSVSNEVRPLFWPAGVYDSIGNNRVCGSKRWLGLVNLAVDVTLVIHSHVHIFPIPFAH
jgi:hypothetical protein